MYGFFAQSAFDMARCLLLILLLFCASSARAEGGDEGYLLHTPVPPSLFSRLRIWDTTARQWRAPRPEETPGQTAPILVVHLWADYCAACKKEFPLVRDFAERLTKAHPGQVEVIYISETFSSLEMDRFMVAEKERMPRAPQYHDTGEVFAQLIQENRPSGQLTLPVTLVLDEQRIVRQSVIGPIAAHRLMLAAGITKLVRLAGRVTARPQMR
jgi:thiol-disulfide isomerase/thioredoxin